MAGEIPGSGPMGPIDPKKFRKTPSSKSVPEGKIGEKSVSKGVESPGAEASGSKITGIAKEVQEFLESLPKS